MLRRTCEALGDLFKKVQVDFILGLIVASLTSLQRVQVVGAETQTEIVAVVFFFTFAVLTTAVIFQIVGVGFTWISEKIPANAKFEPAPHMPLPYDFERDGKKHTAVDHCANLLITNREHAPITDCYVVLKSTKYLRMPFALTDVVPGIKYLEWKGSPGFKVDLDAHGGQAILHVYKITTLLAKPGEGENEEDFHFFTIWNNKKMISLIPQVFIIEINLELHGMLNGKAVSKSFHGYVYRDSNPDHSKRLNIVEHRNRKSARIIFSFLSPAN